MHEIIISCGTTNSEQARKLCFFEALYQPLCLLNYVPVDDK